MEIKQLYTNCLAEAAYYIESNGEAAVIDPVRETQPYLDLAKEKGVKIKYVFETHFHADFVSGHIDLAAKTGAEIVFGPDATPGYKAHIAKDGEIFNIGKVSIKVLHTPGHTIESSCYLLTDENGKEHCLFTGDTLFVGDVGRPDLLDKSVTLTKEDMAGMMYDSLNYKIKPLSDDLIVYPAHGPGSACGKNIGKETWSTLGQQRKTNYALQDISREAFIQALTSDLVPPPAYFFSDARINKLGYENIDQVIERNLKPLSPAEFEAALASGCAILDSRSAAEFEKGFVKGAINIGLDGSFAIWAGTLIDISKPLVLVTAPGKERETVTRLSRVGYDNVKGVLEGGMENWMKSGKEVQKVVSISAEEFSHEQNKHQNILDVRKVNELSLGKVKGAVNIPLDQLEASLEKLDKEKEYVIHCAGGYRSMIASSILKSHGFKNAINVTGGFGKIKAAGAVLE